MGSDGPVDDSLAAGNTEAALNAQADALRAIYGNPLARSACASAATESRPAQAGG